jgi:cytochrome c biogenesis protein CcdA
MIILFIISFLAWVITVLAPCVLPVLPVILWGTLNATNYKRIVTIILSFVVSIILFTFLLKVSTAFIAVDQSVWKTISWTILIVYGLVSLFPQLRENIKKMLRIPSGGLKMPHKDGIWWQILLGASLWPIFTTCSPTYSLIIATILPLSLGVGSISIVLYAVWLWFALWLISIFGRTLIKKLRIFSDNDSRFKKGLAILIILVWVAIITSFDKYVESMIIWRTWSWLFNLEQKILKAVDTSTIQ